MSTLSNIEDFKIKLCIAISLISVFFLKFNVAFSQVDPPSASGPGSVTCGQTATLNAWGSTGQYVWFNDPEGNNEVGQGSTFTTPPLTETTTYYVAAEDICPGLGEEELLFTNCGSTGHLGPTQAQVNSAYSGTPLAGQVTVIGLGIQVWTVPATGTYRIAAYGARGGHGSGAVMGGKGARMAGDFFLEQGDQIEILVGQRGIQGHWNNAGGGGGGTYVIMAGGTTEGDILVIAGGGGGGGSDSWTGNAVDGTTDLEGTPDNQGYKSYQGLFGTPGHGACNGPSQSGGLGSNGGGGGGFLTDGSTCGALGFMGTPGVPGNGYLSGGAGASTSGGSDIGGFGGGGATPSNLNNSNSSGGAGGGYSGGAGGNRIAHPTPNANRIGGGGGGSYNSGTNQDNQSGYNNDHGYVIITTPGEEECLSDLVPVTIYVDPITADAANNGPYCEGDHIYLTTPHVSGANYSWTGPGGFTSSSQEPVIYNADPSHSGTYTVVVSLPNGCTNSSSTEVVVSPVPEVDPENTGPYCFGDDIHLSTPYYPEATYSWTGPDGWTSNEANPVRPNSTYAMAGTYNLSVVIAGGCVNSGSTTVTVLPAPHANATNTGPYCSGDNIQLNTPSVGGATYSWSGPQGWTSSSQNPSIPNATEAMAGEYTVTVVNQHGCDNISTTEVLVVDLPTAEATNTGPYCEGDTIQLNTPYQEGVNYFWTGPGGWSATGANPTIPNSTSSMSGTYSLVAMISAQCTNSSSTTVSVGPVPDISISVSNHPDCYGEASGEISVTVNQGTPEYTVDWGSGSLVTSESSFTIENLAAGGYTISLTDSNYCPASSSVVLISPPELTSEIVSYENQNCLLLGSATVQGSGGTSPYSYSWPPSAGGVSQGTANELSAGNYDVTVTDNNGCETIQTVSIVDIGAITANAIVIAEPVCFGEETGIVSFSISDGAPNYTIDWGTGSATNSQDNFDIADFTAGNYEVTITDDNGCSDLVNFVITEPAELVVNLSNTDINCHGESSTITVTASGGTQPYSGTGTFVEYAGEYSFTVTDNNGCSTTETITISEPDELEVNYSYTDILCYGETSEVTISATGGTPSYTGTGTFNLGAGTHQFTITDTNSCSESINLSLVEPDELTTEIISLTDQYCQTPGSATVQASGGTPPYSYNWPPSAGGVSEGTAGELLAGNYNVTVTDDNGCETIQQITIIDIGAITANSNVISEPVCYGAETGEVNITVFDAVPDYNIDWGTGSVTSSENNTNITGLAAGTYEVTVTDANGCTDFTSFVISQPGELIVSLNSTDINCHGESSTVTVTATGGTSPYSGTGNFDVIAGEHDFIVTDNYGCTSSETITISQPDELIINYTYTDILCYGETSELTITATGGTPDYTGTGTFNITAGTHQFTVTDANSCAESIDISLSEPQLLSSELVSKENQNCLTPGSATVQGVGGTSPYTYNWPPEAEGVNEGTASSLTAGNYDITITDDNGCEVIHTLSIIDVGAISVSASVISHPLCYGEETGEVSITVSEGNPDYLIDWGTGSTTSSEETSTVGNLPAGIYEFTVTDNDGCYNTAGVEITEPSLLTANAIVTSDYNGEHISCYGYSDGSVAVAGSGGAGNYSYQWSENANSATGLEVTGLPAGTYYVTVTDINGCTTETSVVLVNPEEFSASIVITSDYSGQDISCYGEADAEANAEIVGGSSPYTFNWSESANNQDTQTATNLGPGTHSITITDTNGCETYSEVTIQEPDPMSVSVAINNHASCYNGSDGSATAYGNGGTGTYSYEWNTPVTQTTQTASDLPAGTWTVYIFDENNCSDSETIVIEEPEELQIQFETNDVVCHGESNGFAQAYVTGGTEPYNYLWSTLENNTGSSITDLTAGSYTLIVTDSNSCQKSQSVTISEPNAIDVNISSNNVECGSSLGSASASASGGHGNYSFAWSTGAVSSQISDLSRGQYSVTVTDPEGCIGESSVFINTSGQISVNVSVIEQISCFGAADGAITANSPNGFAPYEFTWANQSSSTILENLSSGSYSVTITDSWGCSGSTTYFLDQPSEIKVNIIKNNVSCFDGDDAEATASVSGGTAPYSYLWSNGAETSFISNLSPGSYTVTITDSKDCSVEKSFSISQPADPIDIDLTVTDVSCFGYSNGSIRTTVSGGTGPYEYRWTFGDNTTASRNIYNLPPGTYSLLVKDSKNCEYEMEATISQPEEIKYAYDYSPPSCRGNNDGYIHFEVEGGVEPYSFRWHNNFSPTPYIESLIAGNYLITIIDNNKCEVKADLIILDGSDIECIDIPNAFTPDGDGINDVWEIENITAFPHAHILVYNRWGQVVYEGRGNSDPWDGTYKGKKLPTGTYIYFIQMFDGMETYKGTVTIIY